MLRITTHDDIGCLTLQLEGKLAGPWVGLVRDCWQCRATGPVHVDLRAVTFVDDAGKRLLREMSRQHAQFSARDCQMNAILAEIACSEDEVR
jgi:hypothetical protein